MHPRICFKHNVKLWVVTIENIAMLGDPVAEDRVTEAIRNCDACRRKRFG